MCNRIVEKRRVTSATEAATVADLEANFDEWDLLYENEGRNVEAAKIVSSRVVFDDDAGNHCARRQPAASNREPRFVSGLNLRAVAGLN